MQNKRRAISLIEMLICLALIAILLSTLSFWYTSMSHEKAIFRQLKSPLMEERYAFQRLQRILPTTDYPFFSSPIDQSMSFIFDRGTFEEPKLSGKVLGKLYFDQTNHCLSLSIWPFPYKNDFAYQPSQTFIILDNVESCAFEFYNPPEPFQKPVDPQKIGKYPKAGWQNDWLIDYGFIPALVKITLERQNTEENKKSVQYIFDLPFTIIYPEEKV